MKFTGIFAAMALFLVVSGLNAQDEKRKGRPRPGQGGASFERMLKALDRNQDGKLSREEAPDRMKERFAQMDGNGDGFVDRTELAKLMDMRGKRGAQPGGPAGESPRGKKGKAGELPGPGNAAGGRGGRMLDLARLFKEGDRNGDGNLDSREQQAIIEQFNALVDRMRQMRGGEAGKRKSGDRFERPDTDPVKPKRPGMED
ncbi:MAG: hypothetical protein VX768_20565 [Planctomycetota bacterium]|nr:hypothetical protein [Planctomycetota bacterium]